MNVIWRTLLVHLAAAWRLRRGGRLAPDGVSRVRLTTLPTDLDVVGHMNNGRYLSLFDLGRWDLLMRTGIRDAMRTHGWYAVVGAATITYRKSLRLWQRFDVESRLIGYDERSLYLEHRAVVAGEVCARLIVRARVLRRGGGPVPFDELFAATGTPEGLTGIEPWVAEWADASRLPSTRRPAPSVWA